MTDNIYDITKNGERNNIEFKENLNVDYHLNTDRKQHLSISDEVQNGKRGWRSHLFYRGS